MTIQTELQVLKGRADLMGVPYKGNVSLKALKQDVAIAQGSDDEFTHENVTQTETQTKSSETEVVPKQGTPKEVARDLAKLKQSQINQKRREANKLVRVRITCMNPDKSEHPGEIFTVSNNIVGTIRKYVPFNADEGWHVPQMIINIMKERKCQVFVNKKVSNGQTVKRGKLVNEFAIEILDKLTDKELETLKTKQLAAQSLDD